MTDAECEENFRIAVRSRLYHADLLEAARKMGSSKALAAMLGVSENVLSGWITLKTFPSLMVDHGGKKRKNWRLLKKWPHIEKVLVELTGKSIKELFPEFVRVSGIFKAIRVREEVRTVNAGTLIGHRCEPMAALPKNNWSRDG